MSDRLRVNAIAAKVMYHLYARVDARVLRAAFGADLYLVPRDALALLLMD